MVQLLSIGNSANIPTKQYYVESLEEIDNLPVETPVGSVVLCLLEDGLVVKMKHSSGKWIEI